MFPNKFKRLPLKHNSSINQFLVTWLPACMSLLCVFTSLYTHHPLLHTYSKTSSPWISARLQYLHCQRTGATAVSHQAIECHSSFKHPRVWPHQFTIGHDDVIKWKHFPRNWSFVRGIHRSPVNSPHTGQWRWALMFSLICVWINAWVNNRAIGDLRRYRAHYDVIVMWCATLTCKQKQNSV